MNSNALQELAEQNRQYHDIVVELVKMRRPAVAQDIADLKMADLDSFVSAREREAGRLADALESGKLLTEADVKQARDRLAQINDELKRADVRRRQLLRRR